MKCGLPVQAESGLAGCQIHGLDILPGDATREPGADGLHQRFLGGEACGEPFVLIGFAERIGDFQGRENAMEEPVAETLVGVPDAQYFR